MSFNIEIGARLFIKQGSVINGVFYPSDTLKTFFDNYTIDQPITKAQFRSRLQAKMEEMLSDAEARGIFT